MAGDAYARGGRPWKERAAWKSLARLRAWLGAEELGPSFAEYLGVEEAHPWDVPWGSLLLLVTCLGEVGGERLPKPQMRSARYGAQTP